MKVATSSTRGGCTHGWVDGWMGLDGWVRRMDDHWLRGANGSFVVAALVSCFDYLRLLRHLSSPFLRLRDRILPSLPFPRSASFMPADGLTLLLAAAIATAITLTVANHSQLVANLLTYNSTDFVLTNNPSSGRCPMPPYEVAPPRDVVQHRCVC